MEHHLELTATNGLLIVGQDCGQHLERVGQRRNVAVSDGCGLGLLDRDLAASRGECAGQLVE